MKIIALFLSVLMLISSAVAIKNAICGLQHSIKDDGIHPCRAYIEAWSYKVATNECVQFIYSGCGGNKNRFDSLKKCERKCKDLEQVSE